MNDFSASNMQLFFLSGSKRREVERFFSYEHAAFFFFLDRRGCFGAKLNDFSALNQLFFISGSKRLLWSEAERFFSLEHAAVFRSGSKRLLWSEVERFFSLKHAAVFFSLDRRGCFGAKMTIFQPLEEAALERS